MRKLVIGLFCLFSFIIRTNVFAANPLPDAKPLRVAFYMDNFNAESLSEAVSKIAVTQNFSINLHQKASDVIIVSANIFKNFVGRKRTTDFFKSINFKLENWNIYSIKDSNFFALVLNNKESLVRDSNIVKIYDTAKWKLISQQALMSYVPSTGLSSLNSFKNIFVTDQDLRNDKFFEPFRKSFKFEKKDEPEDLKMTSFLRPMNIVLNGHGGVGAIAGIESSLMTEVLNFFNKLHVNAALIFSCSSGGKNLDFMQFKKYLNNQKIPMKLNYILIVSAISDSPIISSYSEEIKSDEDIDPSTDVKSFFEAFEKSKTKGKELSFLTNILKKLTLSSHWFLSGSGINNIPQVLIPNVGWFQYFDVDPDIQKITEASIAKTLAKPEFESDQSRFKLKKMKFAEPKICSIEVNQKLALLLYSPIVPIELNFLPKKIDMEVGSIKLKEELIGNVLNKFFMPIPNWLKNWNSYFPTTESWRPIYKKSSDPLYFYPSIISVQRGDSINIFSKITEGVDVETYPNVGLLNFIRNSFLNLQGRENKKAFFIKELDGTNDISGILMLIRKAKVEAAGKVFVAQEGLSEIEQSLRPYINKRIKMTNFFVQTWLENKLSADPISYIWHITMFFKFDNKLWEFEINEPLDLCKDDPPSLLKALWNFKVADPTIIDNKLKKLGLNYFADVTPSDYYEILPIVDDFFKQQDKPLKDFLCGLKYETFCDWQVFAKPYQLKSNLEKIKISLQMLKQKLGFLTSNLKILKERLERTK